MNLLTSSRSESWSSNVGQRRTAEMRYRDMKIWIIPTTCLLTAIVITFAANKVVDLLRDQAREREEAGLRFYLSCRIEDVAPADLLDHINRTNPLSAVWAVPEIHKALTVYPDGTLFFFDTPEEQWQALGGARGYAILLRGRIVWRLSATQGGSAGHGCSVAPVYRWGPFSRIWKTGQRLMNFWNGFPE